MPGLISSLFNPYKGLKQRRPLICEYHLGQELDGELWDCSFSNI